MFISNRCGCSTKDEGCRSPTNVGNLSEDLTLLSVKSRLDLLLLLMNKPHCVCDLENHTTMSQSLISHHLADLQNGGFIKGKREGKYIDYSLTPKGDKFMKALFSVLNQKTGGENINEKG